MPPLVEIGLTDLSKSGGAQAPPAPPLATGLRYFLKMCPIFVCFVHNFDRSDGDIIISKKYLFPLDAGMQQGSKIRGGT